MKKLLSAVLVLVMVFAIIPLGAVTASAETLSGTTGDCTWTYADGVLTISGNGAMADFVDHSFCEDMDCDHIISEWPVYTEKIIIKDGVTNIGDNAFLDFEKLTEVIIPSSVHTIGDKAFSNCRNLYYIYIPNGVAKIGKDCFSFNYKLTDIFVPYTVKSIGEDAFYKCNARKINVYYNGTYIDRQNLAIDEGNDNLLNATWHNTAYETLVKTGKNEWSYVVNGIKRDQTTLVKYSDKWFYVENGIWNKTANLLVAYKGKGFYIKNGKWEKETTLVKHNGGYSYVKGGIWIKATTLVKYKDKWFYVKNGVWKKDKLIFKYNGKKFYIDNGKVQFTYTGKVKVDGMYYNIKNGKVV